MLCTEWRENGVSQTFSRDAHQFHRYFDRFPSVDRWPGERIDRLGAVRQLCLEFHACSNIFYLIPIGQFIQLLLFICH